jgi:hypothetical protein
MSIGSSQTDQPTEEELQRFDPLIILWGSEPRPTLPTYHPGQALNLTNLKSDKSKGVATHNLPFWGKAL